MQDRAFLRKVDFLPSKHCLYRRAKARLFGELDQQPDGSVRDSIFRVIQEDTDSFGGHPHATLRVFCKQLLEVLAADLLIMALEIHPSLAFR
jgi:hypothetical protein